MTTIVLEEALRYAYVLALLDVAERIAVTAVLGALALVGWIAWRASHRPTPGVADRPARQRAGVPATALTTPRALG